ncbi:lipopolysaccharide biosynthesis protein [Parabacteroides goldsteinii]|uniref:lipopolysaccharide biosynthesis protein n=1 Tax=Parabacteroides goldsteinii TaxID=328812 RepID=UPI001896A8D2|nr:oligosaccharide flippase family protein [Parabacteroides goldsteinii]
MSKEANKRIAKNTIYLYIRMLFIMAISLYTVRILLKNLGIEGYGIYNVITGTVSMLSTISVSLSAATQRFFNIAMCNNDQKKLSIIFNTCILIYACISIIIVLLGETVGLWFISTQLNFPNERTTAIIWVYQFSLLSFIITMLSIPYSSAIIAHEDMHYYSYIGIIDCLLKLIFAYYLSKIKIDSLIIYSFLLLIISLGIFLSYTIICRKKYSECRIQKIHDNSILRKILSFSGWTIFGSSAGILNNQGNNILINIFFDPIVNAARSISFQICNAMTSFVTTFYTAMRPPLIKSYASKDWEYSIILFNISNKVIFYLMMILCLPIFFNTQFILYLWLSETTHYMEVFTKLALVYAIINALNAPITTLIQAEGSVKKYHLIVESIILLSLPFTYLLFKLKFDAYYTYIISIVVFFIAHIVRLVILKNAIEFISIKKYLSDFIFRATIVLIISSIVPLLIDFNYQDSWKKLIISTILTTIISVICILFIGLNKKERQFAIKKISKTNFHV